MQYLRAFGAVVAGFIIGSIVNMALVMLGSILIATPEGVDPNNIESITANIHLYETKHFIFPFLAHALGAFSGALVAFLIADKFKFTVSYIIGVLFLAGGIAAAMMIPAPTWFLVLDLLIAYLPMAYLATKVGGKLNAKKSVV